jgi:hypothetical protein
MAKQHYFTKISGLQTVVWDPAQNRAFAEFNKQGLFCTRDQAVVKRLLDMGYREITADDITKAGLPLPSEFRIDDGPPSHISNPKPPSDTTEKNSKIPMEVFLSGKEKEKEKGEVKRDIVR